MKIISYSIIGFEFWGEAKLIANRLSYRELDKIQAFLEGIYDEIDATKLNDFFCYEYDTICEILGITEDELFSREP